MADDAPDTSKAGLSPTLSTWISKHGAVQGQPFVVDPMLETTDPRSGEKTQTPNPNPVYRYTFADGSVLEANWDGQIKSATEKSDTTGNKPSNVAQWTPVYATPGDPSSGQIGQWDPVNNEFHPQAASAGAKATGTYTNVIDPNDPAKKRVIGMVDTGDNSWHPISTTADGKQVVTTPTAIYSFDKDTNQITKLVDVAKDSPFQVVSYPDGSVYRFDPNEKDPSKAFTAMPTGAPKQIKDSQGNTMLLNEDTGGYEYPKGVTPAATVSSNTTAKVLTWYGPNGEVIAQHDNPAYQPTPAQAAPPNTVAPYIQVPDPKDPSKLIWIENKGRVTASQALQDLAAHLTGQVVDKNISVDDAKALIDASNQRMTTEAQQAQVAGTAAGDILANTRGNAQTAAGLINQRVQAASGMLQNILGQATGAKNLMSAPAGLGEALTQGIAGYTADLAGGQQTLDSAARMVQMADPSSNLADPATQHAIGVLQQMLDKYQDLTGAPHPAVSATQAAAQSQQAGGLVAPSYAQMSPLGGGVANSIAGGVASQPYETAAQSQARNAAGALGAGVGAGFMAPQVGAGVGSGFVAPPVRGAPVTITVG